MAIIGFFVMTGYIVSHGVGNLDAEDSFIVGNLTGMSAAIARDIYGYYFGNGKGERDGKQLPGQNSTGKKNQITKTFKNTNDTIH